MLRFVQRSSIAAALAVLAAVAAAPGAQASSATASAAAWDHVAANALRAPAPARPLVAPDRFAAFTLDQDALAGVLDAAPAERRRTAAPAPGEGLTVSVPAPDGSLRRFAVVDSPVMAPGLAAQRPDITTYAGRGVDDPTATIRLDTTPIGFHASVRSAAGDWYVDPRYADLSQYVAYARGTIAEDPASAFSAGDDAIGALAAAPRAADVGLARAGEANGGAVTLRTYRLALVSDDSYAANANAGGDTTAAKTVLMNRVNQIYEADLAIRMLLIAQTPTLNLDTAAKYSQANGPCGKDACFAATACDSALINRNNVVAGLLAGAGNYDVAHLVLGTNGGGIAGLGVVGRASKGAGCTGLTTPIGDFFAIDYVAHELGHQFGANHTFAGGDEACAGNANAATAVEPGSGSSIMAYAGICGVDDLQGHSDPYFSQRSLTEISTYVTGAESALNDQQQAALTGFDGTDAFRLTFNGQQSALITRGTSYTAAGLQTAIMALTGGTVTVSAVSDSGFTVTFGGTLAGQPVAALGLTAFSGASGFVSETVAGGTTRKGGSTTTVTANHNPNVTVASPSYTVPARTPFLLDAAGSDPDGDALTYLWEQDDAGAGALADNAKTGGPLFRVFGTAAVVSNPYTSPAAGQNLATATSWRSFPDLAQIAAGTTNAATGACAANDVTCFSELLPTAAYAGPMHFRVSARDNHAGGGGIGSADVTVNVATAAGPFRVTSQGAAATVAAGGQLPVTWNVAGTTGNGVNATDVRISLSTDGGLTFPAVLAASTPNDGSEAVTLPSVTTSSARVKVEAINNVFFDMSHANLTIAASTPVAITAPASADLGSAAVGAAAPNTTVTFTNGGTGTATLGAASLAGADAAAGAKVADACSSSSLPAGASCAITLRLTPAHGGAQSASLRLPSDDGASPRTVALTGTGIAATTTATTTATPTDTGARPAPTATTTTTTATTTTPSPSPPATAPPAPPSAAQLAAALLDVAAPYAVGSAGTLKLYTPSKTTRLGTPRASRRIAAAACTGGTCSGKATAKLTLTPRRGTARSSTITVAKALTLRAGQAAGLTLKLTATQRKAITAARAAKLVLTVTNGTAKVTRTFTLTVG
jgi:hypothetical protein